MPPPSWSPPGSTMIGAEAGCRYLDRRARLPQQPLPARADLVLARADLATRSRYQVLEAQPEVIEALAEAGRGRTVRRSIELTPFGEDFCELCLPLDTAEFEALGPEDELAGDVGEPDSGEKRGPPGLSRARGPSPPGRSPASAHRRWRAADPGRRRRAPPDRGDRRPVPRRSRSSRSRSAGERLRQEGDAVERRAESVRAPPPRRRCGKARSGCRKPPRARTARCPRPRWSGGADSLAPEARALAARRSRGGARRAGPPASGPARRAGNAPGPAGERRRRRGRAAGCAPPAARSSAANWRAPRWR